jgi:hypothetical protein
VRDGSAGPTYTEWTRNAVTDRLGGLDRSGDAQAYQIRQLANEVPDSYWQQCDSAQPSGCRLHTDDTHHFRLSNDAKGSVWCGRLAIAMEHPVRVELSGLGSKPWTIYRVALVDAVCGG